MRFNRRGDRVSGVQGAPTEINGVPLVPGRCCGGWFPFEDGYAGQVCEAGACRLETSDGELLANVGADFFAAGPTRWASRSAEGFFSNFLSGPDYAGASPLWIDEDDNAVVALNYPNVSTIRTIEAGGTVRDYTLTIAGPLYAGESYVRINQNILTVRTPAGWLVIDNATGAQLANADPLSADSVMACRVGARVVLIERLISDASVRVRFADQAQGLTIATHGGPGHETFYPGIVALSDRAVRCGVSLDVSDLPNEIYDVSVSDIPDQGAAFPVSQVNPDGTVTPAPATIAASIQAALKDTNTRTVLIVVASIAAVLLLTAPNS